MGNQPKKLVLLSSGDEAENEEERRNDSEDYFTPGERKHTELINMAAEHREISRQSLVPAGGASNRLSIKRII